MRSRIRSPLLKINLLSPGSFHFHTTLPYAAGTVNVFINLNTLFGRESAGEPLQRLGWHEKMSNDTPHRIIDTNGIGYKWQVSFASKLLQ